MAHATTGCLPTDAGTPCLLNARINLKLLYIECMYEKSSCPTTPVECTCLGVCVSPGSRILTCGLNVDNVKHALVRIHQAHFLCALGPIRSSATRVLGAHGHGLRKLLLGRKGQKDAQSGLNVSRSNVLGRLVNAHDRRRKVRGPLLTAQDWQVRAMLAPNADLTQVNGLVASPRVRRNVKLGCEKGFNLQAQQDIVRRQQIAVRRMTQQGG